MADQGLILHVLEMGSWHTFPLQSIIEKILKRFIIQTAFFIIYSHHHRLRVILSCYFNFFFCMKMSLNIFK